MVFEQRFGRGDDGWFAYTSDKYGGEFSTAAEARAFEQNMEAQSGATKKYQGKPDQIPGLKQAAEAASGRVRPEYVAPDWDVYAESGIRIPTGKYIVDSWVGEELKSSYADPKDLIFKDESYYDQEYGVSGTQNIAYSTGQSVIDQAMADPLSWVAKNLDWGGLGNYADFSALDEQMKFLKANKYDLSALPNQGGVNQYNLTKQILDQGTTGKWSGQGYGRSDRDPAEAAIANAKVIAGMLANTGITDINQFGKFNGVVGRQLHNVTLKDPADPSKGYVYQETAGDEFTGRTLDVPKDVQVRDVQIGYTPEDSYILKQAEIPVYGETFGNKVTKQSFVDAQNYNMAHGNVFSGTYIGQGHTRYGVQFASDGTPYFYTQYGGDTSSIGDIAPILAFLAVIPTPLQPFAAAANALIALDNGNTLGALASLAGIPGVSEAVGAAGLANVATAIKTANQVVNLVNAVESGNALGLLTSAAGLAGAAGVEGLGSTQIGDTGLTVSDALKAANLVKAIDSEDPTAIFNAAVSLGSAPNIEKALNGSTTTRDTTGQAVADVVDKSFITDLVNPDSPSYLGETDDKLTDFYANLNNSSTPIDFDTGTSDADADADTGAGDADTGAGDVNAGTGEPNIFEKTEEELAEQDALANGWASDRERGLAYGSGVDDPAEWHARMEGWNNYGEKMLAESSGITDPAEWRKLELEAFSGDGTELDDKKLLDDSDNPGENKDEDGRAVCAPGFHDDGTGFCVPDEDGPEEPGSLEEPKDGDGDGKTECAPGFHDDGTGFCVPDDDGPEEPGSLEEPKEEDLEKKIKPFKIPKLSDGSDNYLRRPPKGLIPNTSGGNPSVPSVPTGLGSDAKSSSSPLAISALGAGSKLAETWLGGNDRMTSFINPLSYAGGSGEDREDEPDVDPIDDSQPRMQPSNDYYAYGSTPTPENVMKPFSQFARGGGVMNSPLMAAARGGDVPHKGSHYVQGAGGGQDDLIDAKLADGEYVFDADIVASLGDGSNRRGAEILDRFREQIRKHKRSAGRDEIPPPAKSPLAYLKEVKK